MKNDSSCKLPMLLLFLGVALLSPALSRAQSGPKDPRIMERPERIDLEVVRQKNTRVQGGDYDDKRDRIAMIFKARNQNYNQEYPALKGRLLIIGQNVVEKKSYVVLHDEEFDFALGIGNKGGEFTHTTKEIITAYDDEMYAQNGNRYEGWIVYVTNEEGKVCAWKASKQSWERYLNRAMDLRQGAWVDRDLERVPDPEP